MSEANGAKTLISEKSVISITLFGVLSAGLVMVGVYINKIDNLEKMKIPENFSAVRSDLAVIKLRLGIPISRETADLGGESPSPDAKSTPPQRHLAPPRRAATSVLE